MKKENVYILEDRGLLYVSGEDAKEFLQNIITNNIENVTDSKSCFAGLLTPQGKYLYDFIVTKHKSGFFLVPLNSKFKNLPTGNYILKFEILYPNNQSEISKQRISIFNEF